MKILTIFNEENSEQPVELLEDLKKEHQVETVCLEEQSLSYEELVEKIEQCDKVISW